MAALTINNQLDLNQPNRMSKNVAKNVHVRHGKFATAGRPHKTRVTGPLRKASFFISYTVTVHGWRELILRLHKRSSIWHCYCMKKHKGVFAKVNHNILRDIIAKTEQAAEPKPTKEKNPAAVALGRLGGLKGGKARAKKLSSEQRFLIAQNAAQKRWSKER